MFIVKIKQNLITIKKKKNWIKKNFTSRCTFKLVPSIMYTDYIRKKTKCKCTKCKNTSINTSIYVYNNMYKIQIYVKSVPPDVSHISQSYSRYQSVRFSWPIFFIYLNFFFRIGCCSVKYITYYIITFPKTEWGNYGENRINYSNAEKFSWDAVCIYRIHIQIYK